MGAVVEGVDLGLEGGVRVLNGGDDALDSGPLFRFRRPVACWDAQHSREDIAFVEVALEERAGVVPWRVNDQPRQYG